MPLLIAVIAVKLWVVAVAIVVKARNPIVDGLVFLPELSMNVGSH